MHEQTVRSSPGIGIFALSEIEIDAIGGGATTWAATFENIGAVAAGVGGGCAIAGLEPIAIGALGVSAVAFLAAAACG